MTGLPNTVGDELQFRLNFVKTGDERELQLRQIIRAALAHYPNDITLQAAGAHELSVVTRAGSSDSVYVTRITFTTERAG